MALLARGTAHWVALPAVVTAVLFAAGWVAAGLLAALLTLFLANFFRDPERPLAEGIVSPADGVVTEVREAEDGGRVVVIFMNVHNVHVNRAPCDATVVKRTHHEGSKVPAWHKDSERNERVVWDLDTPHGSMRVVQVAGLLARRIVPYAAEGQRLRKGERIGIIRLGSRVDVWLPPGCEPAVRAGDRLLAGSSTLARPGKP
ncbi:MAG TPA: phosphatidylserine decarboxylase [Candidatus Thermoplasmatota archaeon]|jgi:phosphatidylserine decarboxylase|nr:phosphatidylserine decarboxylase [Candidatus Thermoplasmatota archaeon]